MILDVARCYLWLFTLYINIKIGKNSCWLSPRGGGGGNHIRIGNRTRLYAVSVLDCHRHYYFPVPLFPGISMLLGTKLQEFSTALLKHNL